MPGAGIVYCLTVADTQRVSGWLRGRGIDARPYNADIAPEEREALEGDLLANRLKALVATVALGMGFDKPDLGFVVHYQRPGSPIAYYQQVGRAGRAVENAYGILLVGPRGRRDRRVLHVDGVPADGADAGHPRRARGRRLDDDQVPPGDA